MNNMIHNSTRYIGIVILLLSACSPPADDSVELQVLTDTKIEGPKSELDHYIFSEVQELAECGEMLLSQESLIVGEPSRTTSEYATIVEVPCGPAPGTGAYGYPMSLVVEWAAVDNSPEGSLPKEYAPILFHERNGNGSFAPVGYITQAIPYWNAEDLSQGYVHLFYKYAGAGQCGLLTTYSSEAWRSPFEFREARERSCDDLPCEEHACYEPKSWDLVVFQLGIFIFLATSPFFDTNPVRNKTNQVRGLSPRFR